MKKYFVLPNKVTQEKIENIKKNVYGYIFGEETKYLSDEEIAEIATYKGRIAEIFNDKVYPHIGEK